MVVHFIYDIKMIMYVIEHSELRNQTPNVELIPARNVNKIMSGCCACNVMANIRTAACWMCSRLSTIVILHLQHTQVAGALVFNKLYIALLQNIVEKCSEAIHELI